MEQKIISEIKRITKTTGVVPGYRTFVKETGITENDWRGRFWARWGDALLAAGYEPNKISEKYSDEFILKSYCTATRHFKKAPTRPELRMYSKGVHELPSYTTMLNHFGTIGRMRVLAREWAEANSEFHDIVEYLPESDEQLGSASHDATTEGWVYLLKMGEYYKIGRGEELERRVKQVTVALPDKVTLVHSIKTDDPSGIESYWHQRFKEKRANGEWFSLESADVKAFKRRKFQ